MFEPTNKFKKQGAVTVGMWKHLRLSSTCPRMIDIVTKEMTFPTISTSVGNIRTKVGNSSAVLPSEWDSVLETNPAVAAPIR